MKIRFLIKISLISLCSDLAFSQEIVPQSSNVVYKNEDVPWRYHAQWTVDEVIRKKLLQTYGVKRISFDHQGRPILQGLSPAEARRWERLYKLCMSDGCLYCDADDGGSCESGTCGLN